MTKTNTAIAVAIAFVCAVPLVTFAQRGSASKVVVSNCLITAFDQVQLPGPEAGVLVKLDRTLEGKEIEAETEIGMIDSADAIAKEKQAMLEIAVAQAQADSDAELMAAIKTKEVGEAEVNAALEANRKSPGSVSENEIRRLKLTAERAKYEIEVRKMERANHARTALIKSAQLEGVQNEMKRRKIVAPLNGVIVEFMKNKSEWVQPGETICKIVRMDRLRVEGFVSAENHSPSSVAGAKVIVSVDLPANESASGKPEKITVEGELEFVSPIVEASGEYRVWAEFNNRRSDDGKHWIFRPGSVAEMEIQLRGNNIATTSTRTTPGLRNAIDLKKKVGQDN